MQVDTFIRDHLVRDKKGLPLGRVVLVNDADYTKGVDSLFVALLECPVARVTTPLKAHFYIDGVPYALQENIPSVRISRMKEKFYINNVYLEKVKC